MKYCHYTHDLLHLKTISEKKNFSSNPINKRVPESFCLVNIVYANWGVLLSQAAGFLINISLYSLWKRVLVSYGFEIWIILFDGVFVPESGALSNMSWSRSSCQNVFISISIFITWNSSWFEWLCSSELRKYQKWRLLQKKYGIIMVVWILKFVIHRLRNWNALDIIVNFSAHFNSIGCPLCSI